MIQNYNRGWPRRSPRQYDNHIRNERITDSPLRIIDDKGKQVGVLTRDEALNLSRERELDLVVIAGNAKPPVVKLIDYSKFLYQEQKRLKEAKKGAKKSGVKNIKLSLFIGVGDLVRLERKAAEFIKEGHQVRISLLLKGREMGKKPMGFDVISKFINSIPDAAVSTAPKIQGRIILAVISKSKSNEKQDKNQEERTQTI